MRAIYAGFLGVCLQLITPHAQAAEVLRFTAIPDHNASELKAKYEPVAAYLGEKLGLDVGYVPAADYQASVEMFKNGDVQLAWFGGLTGVQARRAVEGSQAIVQGAEDPNYYSYFIAHASTGLTRSDAFPTALADIPFAFGSESSTSGRLMPEFFIRKNTGSSANEFFHHPVGFSGSHPKTVELVASGTAVKAGVVNYKTYDAMVERGEVDPSTCRIIWKTPTFPDYNMTAHPSIDETFGSGTIEALRKALTEMEDPELLAAFQRSALIPASNADFESIATVATTLRMLR